MGTTQIIAVLVAAVLAGFIGWWFLGKHEEATGMATRNNNEQSATVVVKGGYSPSTIVLKKGVPAKLNFDMQDSTACLSHVVFDKLGVNEDLTKRDVTTVEIPTDKTGTIDFACGMNMFHGKVVVK
ncbi:cupredoxin domain-containing protein [uncultured Limosilactobacillus sp.]|uniref:cupredoxin domain-containing protein n=1 Tax=uncultured Limosilactobacillus sp. TaxID=2837629 RepID=UPI0025E10554|nr:cupredoxin domain-containing protein [uncultured Limosilactobacillus sp.]